MKEPWDLEAPVDVIKHEKIAVRVRDRFVRFGPEVISIITRSATEAGGMERLLRLFSIDPDQDFDSQLNALAYLIAQGGEPRFVMRAHYSLWQQSKAGKERVVEEPRSSFAVERPNQRNSAQLENEKASMPAQGHESEAAPGEPDAPQVDTPGYRGPERRKVRRDRRGGINAIQRNRRFGGDRRKNKS